MTSHPNLTVRPMQQGLLRGPRGQHWSCGRCPGPLTLCITPAAARRRMVSRKIRRRSRETRCNPCTWSTWGCKQALRVLVLGIIPFASIELAPWCPIAVLRMCHNMIVYFNYISCVCDMYIYIYTLHQFLQCTVIFNKHPGPTDQYSLAWLPVGLTTENLQLLLIWMVTRQVVQAYAQFPQDDQTRFVLKRSLPGGI